MVDSQNCDSFDRNQGLLSTTMPYMIELNGQWSIILCQYGLSNGVLTEPIKMYSDFLYLTSNLVMPQVLGNRTCRIMSILPLDFVDKIADLDFVYREIQNREYITVDVSCLNSFFLQVKDVQLNPVKFRPDVIIVFRFHFFLNISM